MVRKNAYIPIKQLHESKWLNDLRAKYGSCFYAIDPYVEVFQLRQNMWAMLAPCTHAVGDNWIYLIEGPEKAIFIDNGYGIGNLRGLGEMLTGKPCITAPTHFHGDHAYGSAQFDEIYCHKYCADMMQQMMNQQAWDRFQHVGEDQFRPYFLEKDVLPSFVCQPIPCENHHIINLGEDYDIELIHTGGHAPGLSCFLDKKSRILYTGDAVFESPDDMPGLGTGLGGGPKKGKGRYEMLHTECMDFRFYMEQIEALAERVDEWDYCMPGHGPIDSPATIVTDTRDAIRVAVHTPEKYDEVVNRGLGREDEYNVRRGLARVRYAMSVVKGE